MSKIKQWDKNAKGQNNLQFWYDHLHCGTLEILISIKEWEVP